MNIILLVCNVNVRTCLVICHLILLFFEISRILSGPCVDGDLKVYGISSQRMGRLAVCIDGNWTGICSSSNTNTKELLMIACSTLGFLPFS